ncbi:double-stranded RNA-binding motif protein [Medicago truncatula]|uniref:Double-stranded RNA-binding motif protein n=1 Tax=Medicago truncatula TaxID=3880 RepID=G7L7P9_MEDTR|nr:double-stranded RNA-binding motif protein [Medicago truncatula]
MLLIGQLQELYSCLLLLLDGLVEEIIKHIFWNENHLVPINPVYSTNKSGEAHKPIFSSQVEIKGEIFTGQEAKSKKHAEMSAAKVAYKFLDQKKRV